MSDTEQDIHAKAELPAVITWPEVRAQMGLDKEIINRRTGKPITEAAKKMRFYQLRVKNSIQTLPGGDWPRGPVMRALGAA